MIERLYRAGATAKALAKEYGGTERTIYARARVHGWLRKDAQPLAPPLTELEADAAAREAGLEARADGLPPADAPVRMLAAGASLGDAARAAAETAIRMLRDGQPARSYTYARLAGTLERLARGPSLGAAGDGGGADGTERGRLAALDFLRGEACAE
ncbi:hypothetical protein [Brevundimonas lenta]|uniref:Uncharacterized protein n=1 Tax=Brevundimonas lenta TaxID=424796 RepID=A0A7W6JA38_9CAUL|nr:hypothetical protein [Brevundimonas lenta]MBB4081329.1 hypothetical protein [Brevundimonas lenta]